MSNSEPYVIDDILQRIEGDVAKWYDTDTTRPIPALMIDVESMLLSHKALQVRCSEMEAEISRLTRIAKYD